MYIKLLCPTFVLLATTALPIKKTIVSTIQPDLHIPEIKENKH
jgi:hypothetical protein